MPVTNIYFPDYLTIGDLKELLEDLPSDGLVELFLPRDYDGYVERRTINKRDILFELSEVEFGIGYPPIKVVISTLKIAEDISNEIVNS